MGQWGKGLRAIVHSFSSRTRPLECVSLFFTHLSPGDSKHLRGCFVLTGTVSGLELFCFYFKAQCLASLWGKGRRDLTSVSFPFHLPVFFLPPLPASPLAALSVAFSPSLFSLLFLSLSVTAFPLSFHMPFLGTPTLSSSVRYHKHQ